MIANPATPSDIAHPALRPATLIDMATAKAQLLTEVTDQLSELEGYEAVARVSPMIGTLSSDADNAAEREAEGKIDHDELEFRCELYAEMAASVIRHRGMVSTPAILAATDEQIAVWAPWYESQAREAWQAMRDAELHGPAWHEAHVRFDRQCELLWQVERRAGRL